MWPGPVQNVEPIWAVSGKKMGATCGAIGHFSYGAPIFSRYSPDTAHMGPIWGPDTAHMGPIWDPYGAQILPRSCASWDVFTRLLTSGAQRLRAERRSQFLRIHFGEEGVDLKKICAYLERILHACMARAIIIT